MPRHRHPANQRRYDQRTFGERLADQVTASFGSWAFISVQTVIVIIWIGVNLLAFLHRWDPYPFIVLDRRRWATRDELRIAIVTWIERTYHRRRRQAALGRLTPIEWETIMTNTAAHAA